MSDALPSSQAGRRYPGGKAGDPLTVEFTVFGVPRLGINGGAESACGWCKDRWGISWQITPRTLIDAFAAVGAEAKRAFEAMMRSSSLSTSP